MKLELNTEICPIIIPDTYGYGWQYENIPDWDFFTGMMVWKAKEFIEYILNDLGIPYRNLEMGNFRSPREYNFYTDWIDFSLETEDDYIETIKRNVQNDEENFFRFVTENFGTHEGFISFYPYEKEKFYESEKNDYIFSMWVMYRMNEENNIDEYRRDYMMEVWEYATGNGYVEFEED